MLALVGSNTARPTARRWLVSAEFGGGMLGLVTSMSVVAPLVVAYTFPLRRPTIRALSSVGAIPMVVMAWPEMIGTWLTGVMVAPWFVERYRRSEPKY